MGGAEERHGGSGSWSRVGRGGGCMLSPHPHSPVYSEAWRLTPLPQLESLQSALSLREEEMLPVTQITTPSLVYVNSNGLPQITIHTGK